MAMSLRDLFYIHKADRQVLLAFFCVFVIALTALVGLGYYDEYISEETSTERVPIKRRYVGHTTGRNDGPIHNAVNTTGITLTTKTRFDFDPNTADTTQLLSLGLRPWQVRNIMKYRAAGGIYRTKEDFAQLYGLTVADYRELEPYIHIAERYRPAAEVIREKRQLTRAERADSLRHGGIGSGKNIYADSLYIPYKLAAGETVDLNKADTSLLMRIPGIGSYYARQIVKQRERLGGFVDTGQLDVIEGFPQQSKAWLVVDNPSPRRLNLNRLSVNELRRHPYLNYYQAKAIVDYRRQHGRIESIDELRLLPGFTPEALQRLEHYVEF